VRCFFSGIVSAEIDPAEVFSEPHYVWNKSVAVYLLKGNRKTPDLHKNQVVVKT
jgi:hypothetical protein